MLRTVLPFPELSAGTRPVPFIGRRRLAPAAMPTVTFPHRIRRCGNDESTARHGLHAPPHARSVSPARRGRGMPHRAAPWTRKSVPRRLGRGTGVRKHQVPVVSNPDAVGRPSRKASFHRDPLFLAGYGGISAVPVGSRRTRREALWRFAWSSILRVRPIRRNDIRRGIGNVRARASHPARPPPAEFHLHVSQEVSDAPEASRRILPAEEAFLGVR